MSTQSGDTIWAKRHGLDSSYPLIRHLLDTAAIAEQLFYHWLRPGLQEQITQALGAEAPRIVAAIAGIHDIGKANPLFQGQLAQSGEVWQAVRDQIAREENVDFPPAARSNRWAKLAALRRHEQVSALSLSDIRLDELTTGEAWHILPALGHHGFFRLPLSNSRDRRLDSATVDDCLNFPGWKEKREEISAQFYDALGIDHGTLPEQAPVTVGLLLSGLTVLADRLASHTNWVQRSQADLQQSTIPANDYAGWFAAQKSHAPAHIKQFLGIYEGWPSQEAAQDAILGPGREPYEVQRLTRDNDAGLVAVMSATGSGKTEAALLRHARRHERLLFLLPTQATTNALMRRVQKAYSSTSNVASLAHSLASIEDFYTTPVTSFDDSTDHAEPSMQQNEGLFPSSFVRSGISRLLASVSVATVDQCLKAGLPIKWLHLVLLALANSHIVIDEVHTLDHYQMKLLGPVLEWMGATNSRVTLLTATMPRWQLREAYRAYTGTDFTDDFGFPAIASSALPASSAPPRSKSVQSFSSPASKTLLEVETSTANSTVSAHVSWAQHQRQAHPDARIGIICNQVAWAQEVARELAADGHKVILLHSAMTAEHRRINAERLTSSCGPNGDGKGLTVVGTQAIEASLDIDLDMLSTDLCPASSLLQRLGRLWRHADDHRWSRIPKAPHKMGRIVAMDFAKGGALPYYEAEMEKTMHWLSNHKEICFPDDCQPFVEAATVSMKDLERADATAAEYEQNAAHLLQRSKGKQRSYSMSQLLDPEQWLDELSRELRAEEGMLSPDADELRTRDIEEESVQVIIGSSDSQLPGAWPGTPEELLSVDGSDKTAIRQAMKGSMPIRARKFAQISEHSTSLAGAKTILSRYVFVPADGLYDAFLGFIGPQPEA